MVTNVLDYLEASAARWPDKEAYMDQNGSLTFGQLRTAARAVGTAVAGLLDKGSPVAVYMEKSVQSIAAFLGVAEAGCFYIPIDVQMPDQRVRSILDTLEAQVMIVDAKSAPKAAALGFGGTVLDYDAAAATPRGRRAAGPHPPPCPSTATRCTPSSPPGPPACPRAW